MSKNFKQIQDSLEQKLEEKNIIPEKTIKNMT